MSTLFQKPNINDDMKIKKTVKPGDIGGSSTRVVLQTLCSEAELPPSPRPTAFDKTLDMRESVSDLPLSPAGLTLKKRVEVLEDASRKQNYRNQVMDTTINALNSDSVELKSDMDHKLLNLKLDLVKYIEDAEADYEEQFKQQAEENQRTNKKMAALKQESIHLHRKLAIVLLRVQKIEKELDIEDTTPL